MGRYGRRMYFTGYRYGNEWAELGLIGDRLSFTDDEVITKLGLGYITHDKVECAMDTAIRYELLNAGTDGEISAKQMLNSRTRLAALFEAGIVVDGWYKDDEGNLHRAWVFQEDDYNQLHNNRVSSSYAHDNVQFNAALLDSSNTIYLRQREKLTDYDYSWRGKLISKIQGPLKTLPFLGNERLLTNLLEDKVVLRYINKALNRMTKSGKAVQVTAGRGRTFRWNAWGWLDDIRNKHLVSESKKRKVGDTVNGWVYTQGDKQEYFGVPIYQHWWQPKEELKVYKIKLVCDSVNSYGYNGNTMSTNKAVLPFFFMEKSGAKNVADTLNASFEHFANPANYVIKQIDEDFNMIAPDIHYGVYSFVQEFRIDANAEVEEYDEPAAAYLSLMTKGKEGYDAKKALYTKRPSYNMIMKKIKGDEKDE